MKLDEWGSDAYRKANNSEPAEQWGRRDVGMSPLGKCRSQQRGFSS